VLLRVQADDEGRYVDNLGGEEEVVNLGSLQTSMTLFMTVAGLQEKFVMIHDIDLPLVINHVIKDVLTSILILLYLLPHTNVPLPDQDPGVVDGLGKPKLEHLKI